MALVSSQRLVVRQYTIWQEKEEFRLATVSHIVNKLNGFL